jgi:hypothetical protein
MPNRLARTLRLIVALTALAPGACSSTEATPLQTCAQNSDCRNGAVCALGQCRAQCKTSADCSQDPDPSMCVTDNVMYAVCEDKNQPCPDPPAQCPAPLACATDYRCRNLCETDADCNILGTSGRICAVDGNGVHFCADPSDVDGGMSGGTIDEPPPPGHSSAQVVAPSAAQIAADLPDADLLDGGAEQSPDSAGGAHGQDATTTSAGEAGDAAVAATHDAEASAPWMPNPDAGPLGFTPSNVDPLTVFGDAGVDWDAASSSLSTTNSTNTVLSLPNPVGTVAMNDANATQADLYVLTSLVLDATQQLTISGPRPAVLLVLTTVDIQGKLWVQSGGFSPGGAPGPGGGATAGNTGGGGSYCGVGGEGEFMGGIVAAGNTYDSAALMPVLGGSAGGGNCGGASGGGAVQIVAGMSIRVRQYATIDASGAGGNVCGGNGAGGGGSGGAILLEAPTVEIAGTLAANGGGGGGGTVAGANGGEGSTAASGGNEDNDAGISTGGSGSAGSVANGGNAVWGPNDGPNGTPGGAGGGGAGYIRINTATGSATITGIVSPDLTTSCASQGILH